MEPANAHNRRGRMNAVGAVVGGVFAVAVDLSGRDRTSWATDGMAAPVDDVQMGASSGGRHYCRLHRTSCCHQHVLQCVAHLDGVDDDDAVVGAVCCVDPCLNRNAWADVRMHRQRTLFHRRVVSQGVVLHCCDHVHHCGDGAVIDK